MKVCYMSVNVWTWIFWNPIDFLSFPTFFIYPNSPAYSNILYHMSLNCALLFVDSHNVIYTIIKIDKS